jgi:hypothetical protein
MQYVGVVPPATNVPLIELQTLDGKVIDLYNESRLRGALLDDEGLTFEFASSTYGRVLVRFRAIRNLRLTQPPDWVIEESEQIEHLLFRDEGPWPRVAVKAGGFDYEFDCDVLELSVSDDRPR